jgi:glycine/D-amino acid oxidase-like deaminating enzyme
MWRGVDVILIERGAFGQEAASALNAGQFLTGWAKPVDVMLDELTAQEHERGAKGKAATKPASLRILGRRLAVPQRAKDGDRDAPARRDCACAILGCCPDLAPRS